MVCLTYQTRDSVSNGSPTLFRMYRRQTSHMAWDGQWGSKIVHLKMHLNDRSFGQQSILCFACSAVEHQHLVPELEMTSCSTEHGVG